MTITSGPEYRPTTPLDPPRPTGWEVWIDHYLWQVVAHREVYAILLVDLLGGLTAFSALAPRTWGWPGIAGIFAVALATVGVSLLLIESRARFVAWQAWAKHHLEDPPWNRFRG